MRDFRIHMVSEWRYQVKAKGMTIGTVVFEGPELPTNDEVKEQAEALYRRSVGFSGGDR